jgi:lipopolysaccharide/colanic/teichoic acid biosynthesis glycosyltransferase
LQPSTQKIEQNYLDRRLVTPFFRLFTFINLFYLACVTSIVVKTFSLVKFRTMSVGSSGGTTTLGDKRIIPGGGFLRRYRLDELPQIYNILKGDMSLIGPRPEWIRCAERYSQEIELYDLRHLVRPGLTGWAQVNYPYGQDVNDARAKLSYDLFYIRNFSLLLDFVIVVKTAYVMIFGRGGR